MLGLFSRKTRNSEVGVDFMPTGVAVAQVATSKKRFGQLLRCDFLPSVGDHEQAEALKNWVHQHGLQKVPCVSLIARHDVQMFQLEKPSVEDAELLQAVSWKIKDMVNYDVEAAVVDTFEMPKSPKKPVAMINAVVANEAVVGNYVERIKQSGLELEAIEIHELVSKNYRKVTEFGDQSIALLQFSDQMSMMNIYHQQDLFVTREFKIGLKDVDDALQSEPSVNEDGEPEEPLYDSMLLEIQRSMDYFESSYGVGMVQKMLVFPHTRATERMVNYLQNYVGFEFDFAAVTTAKNIQDEDVDARCFSAYCAALREVEA